jgi:hypothetical protein
LTGKLAPTGFLPGLTAIDSLEEDMHPGAIPTIGILLVTQRKISRQTILVDLPALTQQRNDRKGHVRVVGKIPGGWWEFLYRKSPFFEQINHHMLP